ncbi:MAG: hypothetical protein ABIH18_00220 [Candidatus Omnitrophota bacterium]
MLEENKMILIKRKTNNLILLILLITIFAFIALQQFNKRIEPLRNAIVYEQKGMYPEAITEYTKHIQQNQEDWEGYYSRGLCYHQDIKDFKKAIDDYTHAIKYASSSDFIYFSRGQAYFQIGELNKAQEDVNKAKSLGYKPNDADNKLLKELQNAMEAKEK